MSITPRATAVGPAQAMRSPYGAQSAPTDLDETPNKWVVSLTVMFGVLMSAIDTSVVNVALPEIQGNVGATQQEVTWIFTGYLITTVILMPLTNWLSVRFGRKRVYLASLVIFTASSLMCGMSRTLGELILWRVVQGMGAGTLQPLAQAIFREAFPPREQGMAMALFGFVVLFGPAIGPTLGGYITDNFEWPWIFFINLPIGIIGFFVALRYLVDPPWMRGTASVKVDGMGICLLAASLATLQTLLEQGQDDDWFHSDFICALTAISAVTAIVFVIWELRQERPAVDLRILKNATFATGTIIGGILGMGLFAGLFLLPQYTQVLLGYDATQSGIALMPRSLAMMFTMPIAGFFYNRVGPKILIVIGLLVTATTQWMFSQFTLDSSFNQIIIPQILQGAGFSMIFVSLSTVALAAMSREKMTSATGLYNLIRQLGGSFGTTIVVTLLVRHTDQARAALSSNMTSGNPMVSARIGGFAGYLAQHDYSMTAARAAAMQVIHGELLRQAAMLAYDYVFQLIGISFLLCIPLVFLLKTPKHPPTAAANRPTE
jgi:DHA2 family multidrug resistance protein